MKYLILSFLITTLTACTQLMQGAEQPVVQYRDAKTFKTTCNGIAEGWDSCFRKAKRTCPNGYELLEKSGDSNGVIREIIFSCK